MDVFKEDYDQDGWLNQYQLPKKFEDEHESFKKTNLPWEQKDPTEDKQTVSNATGGKTDVDKTYLDVNMFKDLGPLARGLNVPKFGGAKLDFTFWKPDYETRNI